MINQLMERISKNKLAKGFPIGDIDYDTNKLKEELDEMVEAWKEGDNNHLGEELSDIIILALGIASYKKLNMEIHLLVKMNRIEKRKITQVQQNLFTKEEGD